MNRPNRYRFVALTALAAATLTLYAWRLDQSPLHLHYDEVFFGLQGHSIATTGRDLNGRYLPLYFQLDQSINWYQPSAVYLTALALKLLPLSDAAIRLPSVLVGLANIILMYFVALRIFRRESLAILAAVLLALTPAHLIHSRLAMDYIYPLPFILSWLLCLLVYLERPSRSMLFAATTCLGLGFYTYIASVAMMPIYLAITAAALFQSRDGRRAYVAALAGFIWPLLLLVVFLRANPEALAQMLVKYNFQPQEVAALNPLQRLREAVTYWNVSDRLNLFHNFFSPGYLFVTGGSNLNNSTRQAGVFLAPLAVFLAAGLYECAVRRTITRTIILLGFLTAPIAALVVLEDYAIDRELGLLPFAVLLATLGVERMWLAPLTLSPRPLSLWIGAAGAVLGIGYSGITLLQRGQVTAASLLLIAASLTIMAVGHLMDRTKRWWPAAVCLLLLIPIQFQIFYSDYLTDYPARSAGWFGHNIRGATEIVMARDAETAAPAVYLNTDIPYIRSYWNLYLRQHHREELLSRTVMFDWNHLPADTFAVGSLLLTSVKDGTASSLVPRGDLAVVGTATDPNGSHSSAEPDADVSFVIYRVQRAGVSERP